MENDNYEAEWEFNEDEWKFYEEHYTGVDEFLSDDNEEEETDLEIKKRGCEDTSEETLITTEEELSSTVISSRSSVHPCLRNVDISRSSLKIVNLFTKYPPPEDPGLEQAFYKITPSAPIYDEDGVDKFFDLVEQLDIKPINSMREMLRSDKLNLQYYGIDPRVVRAICEALEHNQTVREIDLKNNWLTTDGCYWLNRLLLKNNIIQSLLLAGCRIGSIGAQNLSHELFRNTTLTTLDLSACDLGNEGVSVLSEAICSNQSVTNLDLSNNRLTEGSAEALRNLMASSYSLKQLNLSWNSLYSEDTWKIIVRGLEDNKFLRDLNLSWNGLGNECIPYFCPILAHAETLEKLNLSNNRFSSNNAASLAKALSKNTVLQEFYIGDNPIRAPGALALIQAITPKKSPESKLRVLDLTNIWAEKNIVPQLQLISNAKPWVEIRLGGILSNYKLVGPNLKHIYLKRAKYEALKPKKKRLRKDFGNFVLSLGDESIAKDEFVELVENFRLKLSESLINEIMNAFPGTQKDTVNQAELKSTYLALYPDTGVQQDKRGKKKERKKS